jgi:hypothetical protein
LGMWSCNGHYLQPVPILHMLVILETTIYLRSGLGFGGDFGT